MKRSIGYLKAVTRSIGSSILDFVYPPYCSLCNRRLDDMERVVCERCWGKIRIINGPTCPGCGRPMKEDTQDCQECSKKRRSFRYVRVLTPFDHTVQKIIHLLKYNRKRSLGTRLGRMLAVSLLHDSRTNDVDLVVPVPLHKSRLRERGYNQSYFLAQPIGKDLSKPVRDDLLVRVKRTRSQTDLSPTERVKNVSEAFKVKRPDEVRGRKVMLVDDVITTGATVEACSRALLEGGAIDVVVAAVASPFETL